jgi:hypothetical protein
MNDIEKLDAAGEESRCTHIWEVLFEVKSQIQEEGDAWIFDEMTVAAGADGRKALDKLRDYVADPDKYGMQVVDFRVVGIRILAEADIL